MDDKQIVAVRPEELEDVDLGVVSPEGPAPYGFRLGGTIPSKIPVHHDPEAPTEAGMSPALGVVGDLGCGKSSTAATLMRRLAERGGRAVAVEFRSDLSRGFHEGGLSDGVGVLRWEGPEKPLRFPVCSAFSPGPDGSSSLSPRAADVMQEALLRGFLLALVLGPEDPRTSGEDARDKALALRLAVREFMRREAPRRTSATLLDSFSRLAGDRSRSERFRRAVARARDELEYWREDHLGAIVLDDEGEGTVTPEDRHDSDEAPVTIVELESLLLPARVKIASGQLSEDERISLAVLPVVAAWAWRLASPPMPLTQRVPPPAYLMIEDVWRYTAGADWGATELLECIVREGRSKNVCVGLTSEFYADLEPFEHFLSTLFVGRHRLERPGVSGVDTEQSAQTSLEAAGVGASGELRDRLGSFLPGDFLLRDWRGRAGFVHVDSVFR